ncbi:MAG: hypothetical protein Q8M94_16130 [Ignavibacteria bacterium]|nr:hypothetical protein [Ignavibacteria bacterium]
MRNLIQYTVKDFSPDEPVCRQPACGRQGKIGIEMTTGSLTRM